MVRFQQSQVTALTNDPSPTSPGQESAWWLGAQAQIHCSLAQSPVLLPTHVLRAPRPESSSVKWGASNAFNHQVCGCVPVLST
jgi:hypothetical protein